MGDIATPGAACAALAGNLHGAVAIIFYGLDLNLPATHGCASVADDYVAAQEVVNVAGGRGSRGVQRDGRC